MMRAEALSISAFQSVRGALGRVRNCPPDAQTVQVTAKARPGQVTETGCRGPESAGGSGSARPTARNSSCVGGQP